MFTSAVLRSYSRARVSGGSPLTNGLLIVRRATARKSIDFGQLWTAAAPYSQQQEPVEEVLVIYSLCRTTSSRGTGVVLEEAILPLSESGVLSTLAVVQTSFTSSVQSALSSVHC